MCRLYKGFFALIILLILCTFDNKVNAASSYFVWEKTEIEVPVFSSLEDYKDDYVLKLYVNGIQSNDYYVEYETNCSTFSTVLTNKIGRYTVYYKAYSKANYISSEQAIIFNVVDKTSPKITLNASTINVSYGNTLMDFDWYKATDDTCEAKDIKIDIDETCIDYKTLGTYTAYITATDSSGNKNKKKFYVKVIDNIKPQISVLKPLIFNCGEDVVLSEYFLCTDDYDGDVTSLLEVRELDTSKIGKKQITLTAKDYSDNKLVVVYDVIIEDNDPPIIELKNSEIILDIEKYLDYDEQYFLQYVSVIDNYSSINKISLIVDISNLKKDIADYLVYYIAADEKNNQTEEVLIVKLRETIGPKIIAEDIVNINVGEEIDLLGIVTVYDEYDSLVKNRLTVDSTGFDNNKSGHYKVKYTCFNTSGIYTEKIITINVIDEKESGTKPNMSVYMIAFSVLAISFAVIYAVKNKKKKK